MKNRKNNKKVPFGQICDIRSNSDFPPLPTVSNTKNLNNHNQESQENGFQKNGIQKNEIQPNDKENRTPTNNQMSVKPKKIESKENRFQKNENGFQKNENGFQSNQSQPNDKENRTPINNQMSVKPEKIVLNELYSESTQTVRRFGETFVKVYRNDFPERIIFNRYELKDQIGEGTFGKVIKGWDLEKRESVAIKMIDGKDVRKWNSGNVEIKILKHINRYDSNEDNHMIKLKNHFVWGGQMWLVFELLSMNLFELLQTPAWNVHINQLTLIKKIGEQIASALSFLMKPELNIIHRDLKPENILLKDINSSCLKIIDFGSACQNIGNNGKRIEYYHQSRFYRSPEVILGLPYDQSIDMWSFGCILFEMYSGQPLFYSRNEFDHMNQVVEILGMPPKDFLDFGSRTSKYFDRTGQGYYYPKYKYGSRTYRPPNSRNIFPRSSHNNSVSDEFTDFKDLVLKMVQYDSNSRLKPQEALNHEFFKTIR